jgi:hypothetical protein
MEEVRSSEKLVPTYVSTRRHNPQYRNTQINKLSYKKIWNVSN